MPRKSEADQYTKFLDSQSADLASGNTTVKPKTSGAKRPGRPKKENVSGSSPFLGRVAATGKITKNNLKKNLEASYTANLKEHDEWLAKGINYIKESTKNDDFQKDLDYDYSQAQQNLVIDENDMREFERINKMNSNQIDKLEEKEIESQYQPLGKGEKDELGFGIKNNQSFTGNPFDLDFGKILETQKTDSNILVPKSSLDINQLEKLGNLKYIISDILSGDTKALNDPTFTAMGLSNVKLAIEWLLNNQGLTNSGMQGLITEPWRLVYRRRPPTMEEFLTEEYIGPDAETLYPWVRKMLIDGFDPATPHRNLIWYYFIGGGKSTASVMSNLYISLCNSLMWHQYKYYGHATTSIYTQVYIAGSMKKSSELLLEPMMNLLDSSPFFERCRSKQQMEEGMRVFEESGDKIDRIYWTTASPTSSIEMSGGSRYKLISNPGQLLGQNIISATMSEITFLITDFHWALDLNEKVYTSAKGDYKLMKDIEIGDKVLTPSGELSEVVNTALWKDDEEFEIEFDNGKKIKCNGDHLWEAVCTDKNGDKFTQLVTTRFILNHPEMEFDIPEFDFIQES